MKAHKEKPKFVICIHSQDTEDLEISKVYQVLPDEAAARDGFVRVIDDSGEDYLYPADYFVPVTLPVAAVDALLSASSSSAPSTSL